MLDERAVAVEALLAERERLKQSERRVEAQIEITRHQSRAKHAQRGGEK